MIEESNRGIQDVVQAYIIAESAYYRANFARRPITTIDSLNNLAQDTFGLATKFIAASPELQARVAREITELTHLSDSEFNRRLKEPNGSN